ncbi:endoplasmic reticulum membrane protein [Paramyrothecium foliicola]|nr:endoplasmic reticulum membrane protein [Paramyrothecium foliicola]
MKLSAGITAALVGCAAAAQQAAQVYMLPSPKTTSSPAISRSVARLILLQRLAPAGKGPSIKDLPNDADAEEVVALLNDYATTGSSLFSDSESSPSQLVVMLEGMTEEQIKEAGDAFDAPAFTVSDPPSASAHDKLFKLDFYNAGATKEHKCSLSQVANPTEEQCWSGKAAVARYDISKTPSVLKDLQANLKTLNQLGKNGEMETTVILLPYVAEGSNVESWSGKPQELRRRQAEQPISTHHEEESASSSETSPAKEAPVFYASKAAIPACFPSKEKCNNDTLSCSGHGECLDKYASADGDSGKNVCFACHCKKSVGDKGGVTTWAGSACSKKDISVPFWLFAGFTLAMVGILSLSIGMLFSVGEEKLPGVIGAGVTRCERLLKECTDQIHRPRKKRTVKPSRAMHLGAVCRPQHAGGPCGEVALDPARTIFNTKGRKTAQIEEKLEGLYSLLRQSGGVANTGVGSDSISIPEELSSVLSTRHRSTSASSPESLGISSDSQSWSVPSTYNSMAPASCICRSDGIEAPPPPGNDDALLNIFREDLQGVCPFVIVAPEVTAADLKATRPFLMAAIRMVASYRSLRSMRAQMYHLMKYIGDRMLIRSERSLDLLLGLIVIVQWYPYHFCAHSQLGNIISLASALVSQLGLSRRPTSQERIGLRFIKAPELNPRTNEERRAYAGAWFLASVCSMGFWRMEPMTHTRYLDECLRELESNAELESDLKLVHLVRIQALSHRILHLNCTDTDLEDVDGPDATARAGSIATFQLELEQLRTSIPIELQSDAVIQMHVNTAALNLHEPPIVSPATISSLCTAIAANEAGQASPLDQLHKSRHALVNWFDHWLSMPAANFYQEATGAAAQLTYAIIMLGRWTKLTTPRSMAQGFKSKGTDLNSPPMDHPVGDCLRGTQLESTKVAPLSSVPGSMRSAAKLPFNFGQVTSRQEADPRLPLELATLRAHIEAQPGLSVDVPELITSIIARFEQVNAALQDLSVDIGKVSPNIWGMGAIRVRISKANLERWAELITEGIEKASLNDNPPVDTATSGGQSDYTNGVLGVPDPYGVAWNGMLPAGQMPIQGYGSPEGTAQAFDPNLWMDPDWDWNTIVNHLGFMEP